MTNVLVVGSGGREHALGWKLAQSKKVEKIFFAPGNGGTVNNVEIQADDIDSLANFALEQKCFTVVGPEIPLSLGIVDKFVKLGLKIFGPTKNAARLESSKAWAKEFMRKYGIPTARFEIFDNPKEAKNFVDSVDYPLVVKADGLASGKGVIVCENLSEAKKTIDEILVENKFGYAGSKIILEERIDGIEASFIAISDGNTIFPMATSQDHKRVFDGDKGPNTGGMGAYSPTGVIGESMAKLIREEIVEKTIRSMKLEGTTFKGFLYAGIMIKDKRPLVLEFNTRMGDPECQPIMMRLDSDLFDYLEASVEGTLNNLPPMSWKKQSAVCVVLASLGYPENYPKNEAISGLAIEEKNSFVFHAGTKRQNGKVFTNGGRVLGVTALGETLNQAIENAYSRTEKIFWENKYCRTDIGKKGLNFV